MSLGLPYLPDLVLEKVFSFLTVRDLKNVRLASLRMSKVVLNLDKRFRTWTIDLISGLPEKTDKVSQYNLNIKVIISRSMKYNEEFYTWLTKHSSYITAIKLMEQSDLPVKVMDSLSQLKQVRKLEVEYIDGNILTTLMSSLGPQLESLTVRSFIFVNYPVLTDLSSINLSSLKHIQMYNCNEELITSILNIVPDSIESLELETRENLDFYILYDMKQLTNMKYLRITNRGEKIKFPTELLCKSLTRLDLDNVILEDLEDLEPLYIDLPSLKMIQLDRCWSPHLIPACSRSLTTLKIRNFMCRVDELTCDFPLLTTLELYKLCNMKWLSQLISACSRSLTTLNLYDVDHCNLDELTCDLPMLTTLELCNIDHINGLSHLISACSRSLTTLKLKELKKGCLDELICDLPVLTTLELSNMWNVNGLSHLISACSRSLKTLKLKELKKCCLDNLTCDLPVLTTLELNNISNANGLSQLISACSRSLTSLMLRWIDSCSLDELTCDLPMLTTLELNYMNNANVMSQLISACSRSLTTLKLKELRKGSLDKPPCDLPVLKVMILISSFSHQINVNHFLRKCSSSLQILYLTEVNVKFEVNVPNLKELYLRRGIIDGFTNLVLPQESRLEIIGLNFVKGSIWDDFMKCRFTNLKVVHMKDYDKKTDTLKKSINKPHVLVLTDRYKWYPV